jgi:hypothetical protein
MPSESDALGQSDFKHLLELLNANEVTADIERSVARDNAATSDLTTPDLTTPDVATADGRTVDWNEVEASPPSHYAVESEPAVLSADPELDAAIAGVPADNENQFAAHIVRGMSKLKAR